MKYPLTLILLLAALHTGFSQTLPSIWRIPYTTGFLQFNVIFEFCADGRVTVIQTGPGTLPNCKVCDWWRFGDEIFIKSLLSEMTATINQSNPAQPFLQNIQLTQTNDILLLYPANTQPDAFFYPVSLAQLAAYKQIGNCPVVPQCTLTNWSTVSSATEPNNAAVSFSVNPNPTNHEIHISMDKRLDTPINIRLMDNLGKDVIVSALDDEITLDVSFLPNGMYFLVAAGDNITIIKKIIKI